jgi:metallo-beta-lactamase class B
MRRCVITAILLLMPEVAAVSQEPMHVFRISPDIEVKQISPHCYVHVSWSTLPRWGRFPSNGVIYAAGGEALLFDTPMTDSLTEQLVEWIADSLHARIIGFVPNHWHDDCIGGLGYLKRHKIPSYANRKTIEMLRLHRLPVPDDGFEDSLVLHMGGDSVICRYLGPGHAGDNIVAWFPAESVLFGGCMVREMATTSLGNTADADVSRWPVTIEKVMSAFPAARTVIPGHGSWGGTALLRHTLELLKKNSAAGK